MIFPVKRCQSFLFMDLDVQVLAEHGIQIEIVKNASHSMAWENPEGLAYAISNAIRSAESHY